MEDDADEGISEEADGVRNLSQTEHDEPPPLTDEELMALAPPEILMEFEAVPDDLPF